MISHPLLPHRDDIGSPEGMILHSVELVQVTLKLALSKETLFSTIDNLSSLFTPRVEKIDVGVTQYFQNMIGYKFVPAHDKNV